jgi:hypothetical protein
MCVTSVDTANEKKYFNVHNKCFSINTPESESKKILLQSPPVAILSCFYRPQIDFSYCTFYFFGLAKIQGRLIDAIFISLAVYGSLPRETVRNRLKNFYFLLFRIFYYWFLKFIFVQKYQ